MQYNNFFLFSVFLFEVDIIIQLKILLFVLLENSFDYEKYEDDVVKIQNLCLNIYLRYTVFHFIHIFCYKLQMEIRK